MEYKKGAGKGWKHLNGSVYEHSSGTRIHMLGCARMPCGKIIDRSDDYGRYHLFMRLNGYNKLRSMMGWALSYA